MSEKIQDAQGNIYVKKKPFYKKWWFWLIAVIIIVSVAASSSSKKDVSVSSSQEAKANYEVTEVTTSNDEFISFATGVVKNNTSSSKSYITVKIPVYDKSGNKLGEALDSVNDLAPNATWKFKAVYLGSEKNVVFKTEELKVSGF